jgi:hypothetical protein
VLPEFTVGIPKFKQAILPTVIFFWIFCLNLIFILRYGEITFRQRLLTVDKYVFMVRCEILILRPSFGITE